MRRTGVLLALLMVVAGCGGSASSLKPNTALEIIDKPVPMALWRRLTAISVIGVFPGSSACFAVKPKTGALKKEVCSRSRLPDSVPLQRDSRARARLVARLTLAQTHEQVFLLLYRAGTGRQCIDLEAVGRLPQGAKVLPLCTPFKRKQPITLIGKTPGPDVLAGLFEPRGDGVRFMFRSGRSASYALPPPSQNADGLRLFMLDLGGRRVMRVELLHRGRVIAQSA